MNLKTLEVGRALKITVRSEPGAVAALEPAWRALQARCPQTTPWQTWEWNEAWWRHSGARKRSRVLVFHAHGNEEPVGLAPLYTGSYLLTPLRRLAWMGTGPSDYLGPLALPEHEQEVCAALLDYLQCGSRGWDIADLQQLRADSTLYDAVRACSDQGVSGQIPEIGHAVAQYPTPNTQYPTPNTQYPIPDTPCSGRQAVLPMEPCPYLPLPASWEQLTARLGKKMRSNLGYYDRLIRKTFVDVKFEVANAQTLDEGMNALFDLHQRRWNARKLPGVLGTGRVQAFHLDVAARFLERGWLRLHLLRLDGQIRAALYCFAREGRTFYYLGGFALELGKYSLGTLLTAQAIHTAIDEGHSEFDFLRGHEPYKYRWLPEERVNQRLLLLRSQEGIGGLRSRVGLTLNRAEHHMIVRARAFAEKQGGKDPVAAAVATTTETGRAAADEAASAHGQATQNGRVIR